jgi:hypothetical protein
MANDDNLLSAQYRRSPVVQDRNSGGLLAWSAYTEAMAVPPAPDDAWIRLRIVAERIPQQLDSYITRTIGYFARDPATVSDYRLYLNQYNPVAFEEDLGDRISGVISAFMPLFAAQDVSDEDVARWKTANLPPAT